MGIAMELGQYTLVEYRRQRGAGRLEIYDGSYSMHKAPDAEQHVLINQLQSILKEFLPEAALRTAPFFLCPLAREHTPEGEVADVVVPELMVLSEHCHLIPGGCYGSPNLVIDLSTRWVSPTVQHRKQALYQKAGIPARWLVLPERRKIQVFTPDGSFVYQTGQEIPLAFAGRSVPLDAFWIRSSSEGQ